jgi:hypothetical protein
MTEPAPVVGAVADLALPMMPADQARTRIAQLLADPAYVKKHLDGSHETKEELRQLHEFSHRPEPGAIITGLPTPEVQLADQAEWAEANFDVPSAVIQQIRERTPISREEYKQTVARKNALLADPAFRARALAGDAAAQRELFLLNVNLSSPIKLGV